MHFPLDQEAVLGTAARILAQQGKAREVAVLAISKPLTEYEGSDQFFDGSTDSYAFVLELPSPIFARLHDVCPQLETQLLEVLRAVVRGHSGLHLSRVVIRPSTAGDPNWRAAARAWLRGEGTSNQGRVRSDNIPTRSCDGLLFRSQSEIRLYQALKPLGITMAPLPTFLRGGQTYRRIEPDFVLIKDGVVMAVEVDGDTVHQETPAEAHARTTMLAHEGVHIERVPASACDTDASAAECAARLLSIITKLKANK